MNNGLFGFFVGANVTVDVQEFDVTSSNMWVKPRNAQLCFIEGTGGGQAGASSTGTAALRAGGAAGVAYQIIVHPSYLQENEPVEIGAGGVAYNTSGGTTGPDGGDTKFAGLVWAGGTGGSGVGRNAYSGAALSSSWGSGGPTSGTGEALYGRHGGWGAGGGGRTGVEGGKPRSFELLSAANTPARGGGAPAATDARPDYDVDGFGEGAGGGTSGNAGKNGRRGSGGGGASNSGATTLGGNGGGGFLRVITYCWE